MALNPYVRKSRWKFWLALFAALIVIASLYYTSILSTRIAYNEQKQVQIWAQAVQERAQLVERTRGLFRRLAEEERKRVDLWAQAIQQNLVSPGEDLDPIAADIITKTEDIPRIWVNEQDIIVATVDADEFGLKPGMAFTDSIRESFTSYSPIRMPVGRVDNFIYYRDSRLFTEIREEIQRVINSFISEVLLNAASVPVVYTDSDLNVIAYGNLDTSRIDDPGYLQSTIAGMRAQNAPIEVSLEEGEAHYIFYRDSYLLTQIQYYPYVQLGIIALFLIVAYYAFSTARKAEQDQVWVGMSKETAHQLGTPISSLSGWIEILRQSNTDPSVVAELEKDVQRLELITERFSKVGSAPALKAIDLREQLRESVGYMQARASKQVSFEMELPETDMPARINGPLFDWVIENLVKNALDAMEGRGKITVALSRTNGKLAVDVTDTGRGIPKSKQREVFQPGFSTKKRGWGLGLSLARRIIEVYHKGRIFVKQSAPDKGTTFRILLPAG